MHSVQSMDPFCNNTKCLLVIVIDKLLAEIVGFKWLKSKRDFT